MKYIKCLKVFSYSCNSRNIWTDNNVHGRFIIHQVFVIMIVPVIVKTKLHQNSESRYFCK